MKKQMAPQEKKVGYFQKENVTTIYVGNLNYKKTEKEIKNLFETFGKVKYVKLVTDEDSGKNKGIAFVQMPNKKAALAAIQELNEKEIGGRTLKVSIAQERNPRKTAPKAVKKIKKEIQDLDSTPKRKRRRRGLDLLFESKKINSEIRL